MPAKLTASDIRQRLITNGRPITLLSYGNGVLDNSSLWKCHDCDHEWNAIASNINAGGGCPRCCTIRTANKQRFSKEKINQRLVAGNRQITLLILGKSVRDNSSLWQCHDCDHKWNATAANTLKGNGCPPCGRIIASDSHRFSEEDIKQRLIDDGRPITLLSYGNSMGDKASLWKCHDCYHEWNATATNINTRSRPGSGCPSCSDSIPLTLEIINQRLIDSNRPITLLHYGKKTKDTLSLWKCHDCDHKWNTSASSILNDHGCPHCVNYGFNPGKPAYFYLHTYNGFIKVGITNKLKQRQNNLNNQIVNETTYIIESTMSWYFEIGEDAADLESTILDMFKQHAYNGLRGTSFDGKTELFENAAHQEILDYIAENYDISYV